MTKVLLVSQDKGGTGKTLISRGLAEIITRLRLDKGQPVAHVEAYLRHRMFAYTVERLRRDGYDDAAAERAGRGRMEGKTEADTFLALGHKRDFDSTPEFLRMMEREAAEIDEAYDETL